MNSPHRIDLVEYAPRIASRQEISDATGRSIWERYRDKIDIEFPSPKTGGMWRLTSQGWVGSIPISPDLSLTLHPKTSIANLFRMLEYAYDIELRIVEGMATCESLPEFHERLAIHLARKVLDRARKGFHGGYTSHSDILPYVRGKLDLPHLMRSPWSAERACGFEEHTRDIDDNQILAWTLYTIGRSGICSPVGLPIIRRAFHALQGVARLRPISPEDCMGRTYHRLNDDYRALHTLCRFFLEHTGPAGAGPGRDGMLPFLIDMARLFESFVAEWMRRRIPTSWRLHRQERVLIGDSVRFVIDLVVYDIRSGETAFILDTKYKTPTAPSNDDIFQIVAYAVQKGCRRAVLVYPQSPDVPLDVTIGTIRVRSLSFSLADDLERAGQALLRELFLMGGDEYPDD